VAPGRDANKSADAKMLMFKIRPLYFFAAFSIGLFMCYIMAPAPEVVVKFPSPYNAGRVVYKDKADTCFKYNASKVSCPLDKSAIKAQPVMEDFRGGRKPQPRQMP
jgi:hypothetical protein